MTLIGPCIFAAPVVAVVAILALPLWPVAIIVLGVARILFWPVARIASASGRSWGERWSGALASWFRLALKPWKYFDPPA